MINGVPIEFLVDTALAFTILQKGTWERCKKPEQQLQPWCQKKLVGAEGIQGEKLQLSVVVIDPLTIEVILGLDVLSQCSVDLCHKKLITSAENVVVLNHQGQDMFNIDLADNSHRETYTMTLLQMFCQNRALFLIVM